MELASPEQVIRHADYLIIGAGASGLGFLDSLLTYKKGVKCVVVDKNPLPGGHWNFAYEYVRLHQPAAHYGLNSTTVDPTPIN